MHLNEPRWNLHCESITGWWDSIYSQQEITLINSWFLLLRPPSSHLVVLIIHLAKYKPDYKPISEHLSHCIIEAQQSTLKLNERTQLSPPRPTVTLDSEGLQNVCCVTYVQLLKTLEQHVNAIKKATTGSNKQKQRPKYEHKTGANK